MIRLYNTQGVPAYPLADIENFCVVHTFEGDDSLSFDISPKHPFYPNIAEEIKLEYGDNIFVIKGINERTDRSTISASLDLDVFRKNIHKTYAKTGLLSEVLRDLLPAGWTALQTGVSSSRQEISLENCTDLEILYELQEIYGVVYQWAVKNKQLTVVDPSTKTASGQYLTDELNLESVSFKGDSTDFITRLYAYGKDGLSIATPANPLEYIEDNTYSDKVVSAVWVDTNYEDAALLRAAAEQKLSELSQPTRSYECSVIDLAQVNPDYANLRFFLYDVVTLIDRNRKTRVNHQVVEYKEYPLEPLRNVVTLSNKTKTIKSSINSTIHQVEDKIEASKNDYQKAIEEATKLITGNSGGYVVLNPAEKPEEILILDQPDKASARNVWRWNKNGLGHSATGYSAAPDSYKLALTADGAIVADRITTGQLNGGLIKAGSVNAEALSASYKKEVTDAITGESTRLEQAFKAADQQLSSTISQTYTTKTETDNKLKSYSTTTQMNSAITQKANEISTEVRKKVNESELGTKITQNYESVRIAWNKISQIIQFELAQLRIYDSSASTKKLLMALGAGGSQFYRDNIYVGNIGTSYDNDAPSKKGLAFHLDQGSYMTWAYKKNSTDAIYTRMLSFEKGKNLSLGCAMETLGNRLYIDPSNTSWLAHFDDGYGGIYSTKGIRLQCNGNTALTLSNNTIEFFGGNGKYVDFHYMEIKNVNLVQNALNIYALAFYNGSRKYLEIQTYDVGLWGIDCWASDGRMKRDISPSDTDALALLLQINHRQFNWKEDGVHQQLGYIAQELEEVCPDFVTQIPQKNEEGEVYDHLYQVCAPGLLPAVTRSIQQLNDKIEHQNRTIKRQQEMIDWLAAKLGLSNELISSFPEDVQPISQNEPAQPPARDYGEFHPIIRERNASGQNQMAQEGKPKKSYMTYGEDGSSVTFTSESESEEEV